MSRALGPGFDCGVRLFGRSVSVANADAYPLGGAVADEVERAGDLGGDGDEPDMPPSSLLKALEEGDIRRLDVGRGMHAALRVRDERAFEMNTDRTRVTPIPVRGRCQVNRSGDAFERGERLVDRGRDGGRKVVTDAVIGHEAADRAERVRGPFHDVVACAAMGMNVKEGGGQGGVSCWRGSAGLDFGDHAVAVDGDDRELDGVGRGDESPC